MSFRVSSISHHEPVKLHACAVILAHVGPSLASCAEEACLLSCACSSQIYSFDSMIGKVLSSMLYTSRDAILHLMSRMISPSAYTLSHTRGIVAG